MFVAEIALASAGLDDGVRRRRHACSLLLVFCSLLSVYIHNAAAARSGEIIKAPFAGLLSFFFPFKFKMDSNNSGGGTPFWGKRKSPFKLEVKPNSSKASIRRLVWEAMEQNDIASSQLTAKVTESVTGKL